MPFVLLTFLFKFSQAITIVKLGRLCWIQLNASGIPMMHKKLLRCFLKIGILKVLHVEGSCSQHLCFISNLPVCLIPANIQQTAFSTINIKVKCLFLLDKNEENYSVIWWGICMTHWSDLYLIQYIQQKFEIPYYAQKMPKLILSVIMLLHWFACIQSMFYSLHVDPYEETVFKM